jgi:hypothetical protein
LGTTVTYGLKITPLALTGVILKEVPGGGGHSFPEKSDVAKAGIRASGAKKMAEGANSIKNNPITSAKEK